MRKEYIKPNFVCNKISMSNYLLANSAPGDHNEYSTGDDLSKGAVPDPWDDWDLDED